MYSCTVRTLTSDHRLIDNESEIEIGRRHIGRWKSIALEITRRVKYDFSTSFARVKYRIRATANDLP